VNADAPWPTPSEAEARVLRMQAKLHRWATDDPNRRFVDLFNLVADPAFLRVAWRRVRSNRGARSAGIDGQTAYAIEAELGEEAFLAALRAAFRPPKRRMVRRPFRRRRPSRCPRPVRCQPAGHARPDP